MNRFVLGFFFTFLGCSPLFSTSIQLINDYIMPLEVKIINARGAEVGSLHLNAGEQRTWEENQNPFQAQGNRPYTPYRVIWLCPASRNYDYNQPEKGKKKEKPKYQSEFGSWPNVGPGSTITATGSSNGNKTCVIKKSKEKKSSSSSQKSKTQEEKQWSNDGPESWSND